MVCDIDASGRAVKTGSTFPVGFCPREYGGDGGSAEKRKRAKAETMDEYQNGLASLPWCNAL